MRKLITISDDLNLELVDLQKETHMPSFSALIGFLVYSFKTASKKNPVGRPKTHKDDEDQDDGVARYQSPDYPKTASPYTKAEVDAWYDFRGLPVPDGAYKPHPGVSA